MNTAKLTQDICNIIQRVYGDATQTFLDEAAARAIVQHIEGEFASMEMVAAIVMAAGGRVVVPRSLLEEPLEIRVFYPAEFPTDIIEVSARPKVKAV